MDVPTAWFKTFAVMAAVLFCAFLVLYGLRLFLHFNKCAKEWDNPLVSPYFGTVSITLVLFAFVAYDITDVVFGRVLFWIGASMHFVMTIAKFGEWIGTRCDIESILASWLILPVGLFVSALVAPLIPAIIVDDRDTPWYAPEGTAPIANLELARFFASFGWLMWITLFVISFFKVVTTHNSDDRLQHSIWIWIAAPCVAGLAEFIMCAKLNETMSSGLLPQCAASFTSYYFLGGVLFVALVRAAFPSIAFFWRDAFNMVYWTECFAFDTLAACSALYYLLTGYKVSKVLMVIFLVIATIANILALLHTIAALVRRRGVFTPEVKWGPLSFMKLTHEAFRAAMPKLRAALSAVDLADTKRRASQLELFISSFSRFAIVLEQHAIHEDEIIFKVFNDFFSEHAKKYNEDHATDFVLLNEWRVQCNVLLASPALSGEELTVALSRLQNEIPVFLDHFLEHLQGEEDHLNPIGRRYLPLELQKQISRAVFEITPADQWEVIVPFIVNNLPRHLQRVRYLKCLAWSMPERAQQIGAMVYRNTDAVMWERLRVEVPEIIPRGVQNWRRYL
jgi:tellurite resistance protein TehA-like permease